MFIIEYLLLFIAILSSIFGILLVLLQGSQSSKGLFEDGGSNFMISQKGNIVTRLTSLFLALFLISNLALAYIRHISKEKIKMVKPSFIEEERLSTTIKKPIQQKEKSLKKEDNLESTKEKLKE